MDFIYFTLAGAIVLVAAAFIRNDADKSGSFLLATFFAAVPFVFLPAQGLTTWLNPTTMDLSLYRADLSLHLDPLNFCRFVYSHEGFRRVLLFGYNALPLVLAIFYSIERPGLLVAAAAVGAGVALIFYNLFPAVGPAHAFLDFPFGAARFVVSTNAPRNCMPSMHFTWAMLMPLNSHSSALKIIGWLYVVFMSAATIGLGEHYYVDLIAAVPFCFLMQFLAKRFIVTLDQPRSQ